MRFFYGDKRRRPTRRVGIESPRAGLIFRQDDGHYSMLFREATRHETLTFDLHPLYASILKDGSTVREGEVLGLDGDLRRVMIAPFDGLIRLLVTGEGRDRRVKVFLSEQISSRR